jgi:hypothetical protein
MGERNICLLGSEVLRGLGFTVFLIAWMRLSAYQLSIGGVWGWSVEEVSEWVMTCI